ncbi:P12 family lipoprotein [Borreliella bavariensis]|uniref:P12 family lipoprotein n=1 Tax=Borreliella bavariensis TaxID=664662 RepID=UPI001C004D7B|nr:P12 family lipoprotein [Borreliella bavariensis]
MKKNILATYILMLVSLLSCNISDPNTNKLENKKTEKKGGDQGGVVQGFMEKIQEEGVEAIEQYMEERERQIMQTVSAQPVDVNRILYYPQKEIEIKEEALIPSTDEEKRVDKAISDGRLEFDKSVYNENELKSESNQLESNFNTVYNEILKLKDAMQEEKHIVRRINQIIKNKSEEREYQVRVRQNKLDNQALTNLLNQLLEKRKDIEGLHTQLDSGLSERASAKSFFEQSQKTLKDAITERLKNEHSRRRWSRTSYGDNLIKKANHEIDDALEQLKTSSFKIVKAIEIKERIKQLLEEVKNFLTSSKKQYLIS